jgi:hypothetical protein
MRVEFVSKVSSRGLEIYWHVSSELPSATSIAQYISFLGVWGGPTSDHSPGSWHASAHLWILDREPVIKLRRFDGRK